jgi:hypothetical protein
MGMYAFGLRHSVVACRAAELNRYAGACAGGFGRAGRRPARPRTWSARAVGAVTGLFWAQRAATVQLVTGPGRIVHDQWRRW